MRRQTIFRFSLIGLSVVLGALARYTSLDSYQVPYIIALQQAVLQANLMQFMVLYAHIGDTIVWVALGLLLLALYSNRPRKALKLAGFLAIVSVIVIVFRLVFPVQRPYVAFSTSVNEVHGFITEAAPSYPSGHVSPTAGGLYIIAGHARRLQVVFAAMTALLAVARVATGTHYFSDVIGAVLFSYPIAAIIDDMKLFQRFRDQLEKPSTA